jgi:hypothetical protein
VLTVIVTDQPSQGAQVMPKYVIEREIPGAGSFSDEDLKGISQKSCGVLDALGTSIQWIESYVTDDKIYCVYRSDNEDLIRQHAEQGGFPANAIARIRATIEPATAE